MLSVGSARAVEADIIWQNTAGERAIWIMNGAMRADGQRFTVIDPEWQIVASGDFNGDGKPDLVWQNTATGEGAVWFMNGTSYLGGASLGFVDIGWRIVAAGDFNGDGKPDLVWEHRESGGRAFWLMNGMARAGVVSLGFVASEWQIVGVGDFDSDSKPDLVWQNTSTGERAIWFMNGTILKSALRFAVLEPAWEMAAAGDFNNDGKADILWQNVNGDRAIWLMNGINLIQGVSLGNVSSNWRIATTVPVTRELQFFSVPKSGCFINCVEQKLTLPYSISASASSRCAGSCPATYEVDAYKLQAIGKPYTVTDLVAENLTTGSSVTPSFSGLSNGQVIAAGQSVTFRLQSSLTRGATVNLRYFFRIAETGQTFSYTVSLQTN